VLFVGDYATGKTSLIRRYTEGFFSPNYKLTIGVDFAVKEVSWDSRTNISLQLWDVAGHERFGTMTRVYYRYAIAAIIVFDVSRPATFEAVAKWRDDVNSKVVDVDGEKLDAFVRAHNMIGWFATSAQDNINVDNAMKFLIGKILEVSQKVQLVSHQLPAHNTNALSVVQPDGSVARTPAGSDRNARRGAGDAPESGGCDC
jgi:Ras-related protein Rab-32